jgi:RNA polymerase sigma-70 factor (ECF subfamily)
MQSTHMSLLQNARSGSEQAWVRVVELYQPLIYGWLRRHDVSHHDAEDLAQDVMAVVVRELPSFEHSGRVGAFRSWLRQITANRAKGYWRAGKIRPAATGQSSLLATLDQLEDENSDASKLWNQQHDDHVLRQLLHKVESECEPTTFQAFRRLVFEGQRAEQVASDLGISVGAAYSAKSRVLRRLREEARAVGQAFQPDSY